MIYRVVTLYKVSNFQQPKKTWDMQRNEKVYPHIGKMLSITHPSGSTDNN